MDISKMTMIPALAGPGEKARYFVWLPEGKQVGAPKAEFEDIPLDKGVLGRLGLPTSVHLALDEEDKEKLPEVRELKDYVNSVKESQGAVEILLDEAVMKYDGMDSDGANWLILVWEKN